MRIKDFSVGQTVFIVNTDRTCYITEQKVAKVGRKYVTISDARGTRYEKPASDNSYLIEPCAYRAPTRLFSTYEAATEFLEMRELKTWIERATTWSKMCQYTIDQLRTVKKILSENDQTET